VVSSTSAFTAFFFRLSMAFLADAFEEVALGREHDLAVVLEPDPKLAGLVLHDLELVSHVDLRVGARPNPSEPEGPVGGQALSLR
jgi:hypothetical protein